jgi:flagellar biosynthesis/type III secretory pathway chaperone
MVLAETLELAQALLGVLERENAALAATKFGEVGQLVEAKNRLIGAYGFKLEEIRDSAMTADAEPVLAELRRLNEQVLRMAEANAAALQGAIEGNQQVLDLILRAAGQQAPVPAGYGRSGAKVAGRAAGYPPSMMNPTKL